MNANQSFKVTFWALRDLKQAQFEMCYAENNWDKRHQNAAGYFLTVTTNKGQREICPAGCALLNRG